MDSSSTPTESGVTEGAEGGMRHLSVVMPAYEELPNLRLLIPGITAAVASTGQWLAEIIVSVPSFCPDAERGEISALGGRAVVRAPTDSFGDAIRTGLASVSPDSEYVIVMDADGSHDPGTIARLLAVTDSADVVVASRYTHGGSTDNSLPLRVMSRSLNWTYGFVLGIKCHDVSTNFKRYRASDACGLTLTCANFDIVEELLFRIHERHGKEFSIVEIPDRFYERQHGQTKRQLGPFIVTYLTTLAKLRYRSGHPPHRTP